MVRKKNIIFPPIDESPFYEKITEVFKEAVRKEEDRLEQQRIKEQIREEQRAEKERETEIKKLESQEKAIEVALERALKKTKDEHNEEILRLRQQLEEAHSLSERAKSQAQLTKSGYVYVISNIGSFGEGIYKVGMTRRLEPMDRVKELGDASVPFPFDVHMMISCEDAPNLERVLHNELHPFRSNKVNFRKEYFKVSIAKINEIVEKHHGKIEYTLEPEALEYRETQLIEDKGTFSQENSYGEIHPPVMNESHYKGMAVQ